jgi:hypothetical protein
MLWFAWISPPERVVLMESTMQLEKAYDQYDKQGGKNMELKTRLQWHESFGLLE